MRNKEDGVLGLCVSHKRKRAVGSKWQACETLSLKQATSCTVYAFLVLPRALPVGPELVVGIITKSGLGTWRSWSLGERQ